MPRRPPPPPRTRDRQARQIARALAHVEAHLGEPLDAARLADRAAMSRHHFHRVFSAHVGCSVGQYVGARRLQRAGALLASGREPVLDVALAVGFESAQALAKAMRRTLGCTPTDVRRGRSIAWSALQPADPRAHLPLETTPMNPERTVDLPANPPLHALTATARGMVGRSLQRAARQAFDELAQAVGRAGAMPQVRSCIALAPDDPRGPDDPDCRYVAGLLFGFSLATLSGTPAQPPVPLGGSLAWTAIAPGRYAVFKHLGPYDTLHRTWDAIYRDWLPASGRRLRDVPPLELCITTPDRVPPAELHTELWIPLA